MKDIPLSVFATDCQKQAECRGIPAKLLDIFFPQKGEKLKGDYRVYCDLCPVVNECLEYALIFDLEGIWGGLNDRERRIRYNSSQRELLREDYEDLYL